MNKLSDYAHGKLNNFNLIRILAATAVLVTHSFALALGSPAAEPFRSTLGMTMGAIAVDVFFITSGFLVTGSLLSRRDTMEFIVGRALRIYPALFVMVLVSVLGLGVYFTNLPLMEYIRNGKTLIYLIKTSTLVKDVAFILPGVFSENPYKDAVNGSLWTMPYEIRMYGILVAGWMALKLAKNNRLFLLKSAVILAFVTAALLIMAGSAKLIENSRFTELFYMFFTGAAFCILKQRIPLRAIYFIPLLLLLLLSPFQSAQLFTICYRLSLAYILFYLAYVPGGVLREYNRLGDYSYGVYIWAFPIQQSIMALQPGTTPLTLIWQSGAITLVLAVLSWHLIEKRALAYKSAAANLLSPKTRTAVA